MSAEGQQQQGQQQQQGGSDQGQQQQQQAAWYAAKNDPEFTGYLQNRGLDKKDAAEAAFETYKAHRNAEKMLGAPSDQMLRLPKDPNDAAWGGIWERLGRPSKEDAYDFKEVKAPDGTDLDSDFLETLRAAAFAANMPQDKAVDFARRMTAFAAKKDEAERAERSAVLKAADEALRKSWGPKYDANLFIARQAAARFGIKPEVIKTLEDGTDKATVLEMFRQIGMATGEARYIENGSQGGGGVMTAEGARAKLAELKSDKEWGRKLLAGDAAVTREFNALTEMMTPQAA